MYEQSEPVVASPATPTVDTVETAMRSIAQNIIAVVFGLLPLFFIPVAYAPFGYTKTFFVIVGVFIAIIFYSLSVLRSGTLKVSAPLALLALWGVVAATAVSGLLSGDLNDTFLGDVIDVQTVSFLALLALIATVMAVLGQSKASIIRLYLCLTGSAVVLTLFHVSRLVFGPDFLSLGIFTNVASTPVGGWNDLGLLFGLIVLLALVALEQLPLTKWGRVFFSCVIGLSLVMLAVVNFTAVWVVLGLVSLVVLMYSLTKDRFSKQESMAVEKGDASVQSIVLSAAVFVASLLFIIGGSAIGGFVANLTGVSYVEVRPSFEATLDVARGVYAENALVGVGPNKFVDAWRQYKDVTINQTIFWDTTFSSGSGYIPTMLVTTGVLGVVAWVAFMFFFVRAGLRMLLTTQTADRFWYFIGSSAFVAAVYLWGMSIVFVPGATMLLLAGVFTSITFTAYASLVPTRSLSVSVASNKRSGIVLVGIVMVIILVSASALYYAGRHYASTFSYNQTLSSVVAGVSIESIELGIAEADNIAANDVYAAQIAQYQLAKLNNLITVAEPSAEQQQQFQQAAATGINAAQIAVSRDTTEPRNHAVLGSIYSVLASAGVEGARDRAIEAYKTAQSLDPMNPTYLLLEAQALSRTGDLDGAREAAIRAIQLKNNYDEALFFLTQLEIAAGNVEDAVVTSQAMISLEPSNPGRHYQLGVLLISAGDIPAAVQALERAVALDENYANARYFLALAYAELDRDADAIAQLEVVQNLNPENTSLSVLIEQLQNGTYVSGAEAAATQVAEPQEVSTDGDDIVTTTEDPETSLVTPINTVPDTPVDETVEVDSTADAAPSENTDATTENSTDGVE